jgi:hypothetical protein
MASWTPGATSWTRCGSEQRPRAELSGSYPKLANLVSLIYIRVLVRVFVLLFIIDMSEEHIADAEHPVSLYK